jgi:hypothetical protein
VQIFASERFLKNYHRASVPLQGLAEGAIHDFVARQCSEPKIFLQKYDRLAHLSVPVLEVDLSGGPRLLAYYNDDTLTLLDMGGHEVVGQYDSNKLVHDIVNSQPIPDQFWPHNPSKFFSPNPDDVPYRKYPDEVSSDWLYFLEDEQYKVYEDIATAILNNDPRPHFIVGGPGTGKTCIILNLLKLFVEGGYNAGIIISSYLKDYIKSAGLDITPFFKSYYSYEDSSPAELLFIDDPENIRDMFNSGAVQKAKMVVAAFDPLQLPYDFTDRKLDLVSNDFAVCRHELTICYRQKETVGQTTKNIVETIEASTPFLKQEKIDKFRKSREHLFRLSNNLKFVNPHGYTQAYSNFTIHELRTEVNRILKNQWLLWTHWPGLLILTDGYSLSAEDNQALQPLLHKDYIVSLPFERIEEIKGLEFQYVFIFMDSELYDELQNGFRGSGQKEYRRRQMYRIPFSRAKDGLIIFTARQTK